LKEKKKKSRDGWEKNKKGEKPFAKGERGNSSCRRRCPVVEGRIGPAKKKEIKLFAKGKKNECRGGKGDFKGKGGSTPHRGKGARGRRKKNAKRPLSEKRRPWGRRRRGKKKKKARPCVGTGWRKLKSRSQGRKTIRFDIKPLPLKKGGGCQRRGNKTKKAVFRKAMFRKERREPTEAMP